MFLVSEVVPVHPVARNAIWTNLGATGRKDATDGFLMKKNHIFIESCNEKARAY